MKDAVSVIKERQRPFDLHEDSGLNLLTFDKDTSVINKYILNIDKSCCM